MLRTYIGLIMDLFSLIFIASYIVLAVATFRQLRFARYFSLEDRNMTTGILSAAPKQGVLHCASFCVDLINCESFVYNPETKECQLHNMVFTTAGDSKYQPGLQYHYMIKDINDWCPLKDGYQLLAQDGPCIKFHFDLMNWHDANESCSAYSPNSRLAVLDTKVKNDLVKAAGMAINDQFTVGVAIGLYEREDNVYRWVDGHDANFTDWIADDWSEQGVEDCGWLHRAYTWRWNRFTWAIEHHHVCEIAVDLKLYRKMMKILN